MRIDVSGPEITRRCRNPVAKSQNGNGDDPLRECTGSE